MKYMATFSQYTDNALTFHSDGFISIWAQFIGQQKRRTRGMRCTTTTGISIFAEAHFPFIERTRRKQLRRVLFKQFVAESSGIASVYKNMRLLNTTPERTKSDFSNKLRWHCLCAWRTYAYFDDLSHSQKCEGKCVTTSASPLKCNHTPEMIATFLQSHFDLFSFAFVCSGANATSWHFHECRSTNPSNIHTRKNIIVIFGLLCRSDELAAAQRQKCQHSSRPYLVSFFCFVCMKNSIPSH